MDDLFFFKKIFLGDFCEIEYVKGSRNTNECPNGADPITSLDDCKSAAQFFDMNFGATGGWSSSPKGCITSEWDGRGVYYNTHSTGNQHNAQAQICVKSSVAGAILFYTQSTLMKHCSCPLCYL